MKHKMVRILGNKVQDNFLFVTFTLVAGPFQLHILHTMYCSSDLNDFSYASCITVE